MKLALPFYLYKLLHFTGLTALDNTNVSGADIL
jgi:hypothetical protein